MKNVQGDILQKLIEPRDMRDLRTSLQELLDVQAVQGAFPLIPAIAEWLKSYQTSDKLLMSLIGLLLYPSATDENESWKRRLAEIQIEDLWEMEGQETDFPPSLGSIPLVVLSGIFWGLTEPDEVRVFERSCHIFRGVNLLHFKEVVLYSKHLLPGHNLLEYSYLNSLSLLEDDAVHRIQRFVDGEFRS